MNIENKKKPIDKKKIFRCRKRKTVIDATKIYEITNCKCGAIAVDYGYIPRVLFDNENDFEYLD